MANRRQAKKNAAAAVNKEAAKKEVKTTVAEETAEKVTAVEKVAEKAAEVKEAVKEFKECIAVGIDAKNGMVATEGWLEKSDVSYLDLGLAMEDAGVKTIIFTDISRDGTLTGVNTEQLGRLNETVSCNIIASGGVSSIKDIEDCLELNLYGCICGKALYTGALNLEEAERKAGVQTC